MSALQEEEQRLRASSGEHLEKLRLEFQKQREQLQLEQSRQARVRRWLSRGSGVSRS